MIKRSPKTLPLLVLLNVAFTLLSQQSYCLADEKNDIPPASKPASAGDADIDFGPYMSDLNKSIKSHWSPPGWLMFKEVVASFQIHREGRLSNLQITQSSGALASDKAAQKAIEDASPFHALPEGAPENVDIEFTFSPNFDVAQREKDLLEKIKSKEATSGVDSQDLAPLLASLADCYLHDGKFSDSERLYERSIDLLNKGAGSKEWLIRCYEGLAHCNYGLKKYADNANNLRMALSLAEKQYGPDSLDCAELHHWLGHYLIRPSKFSETVSNFQAALTTFEKQLQPADPLIAHVLADLAYDLTWQQRHSEALPLFKRASEIREKTHRDTSPEFARILSTLADCYASLKKYPEAEPLYRRAIAIFGQEKRKHIFDFFESQYGLAVCLHREHKDTESESLLESALRDRLGITSHLTSINLEAINELIAVRKDLKKPATEQVVYQMLLEQQEKEKPGPSFEDAQLRLRLVRSYYENGQYAQAIPLLESMREECEKAGHESYYHIDNILVLLGQCYFAQKKHAQAIELFELALAVTEHNSPAQFHTDYQGSFRKALAGLYVDNNRAEKAFSIYGQGNRLDDLTELFYEKKHFADAEKILLKQLKKAQDDGSSLLPENIITLNRLAIVYEKQGMPTKAEALYTELVRRFKQSGKSPNPDLANSLSHLAWFNYRHGKLAQAESNLKRALLLRPADRSKLANLYNLATVAEHRGNTIVAQKYCQEALDRCRKTSGMAPSELAGATAILADFHWKRRRFALAEPLVKEEWVLVSRSNEPECNPNSFINLRDFHKDRLGSLYLSWGKYSQAEQALTPALTKFEKDPMEYFRASSIRSDLATAYRKQRRYGDLAALDVRFFRASTIHFSSYDRESFTEATWAYGQQKKFRELNEFGKFAESKYGHNHPFVQAVMGRAFYLEGNYSSSETAYKAALNSLIEDHANEQSTKSYRPDPVPGIKEFYYHEGNEEGNVPHLEGATNGTIGPPAADATVITGVNTAGELQLRSVPAYFKPAPIPFGGNYKNKNGLERTEPLLTDFWPPIGARFDDGFLQGGYSDTEVPGEDGYIKHLPLEVALAYLQTQLANVYRDWRKYKEAEPLYRSAIDTLTRETHKSGRESVSKELLANTRRDYAEFQHKMKLSVPPHH